MISCLIRARLRMLRNVLLRASRQERARARTGLLLSSLMVFLIGFMAYGFANPFVELAIAEPAMQVVLDRLPAALFFAAFWMLLLSAVTVSIQTFYLNQEMTLLLSAPIPARAVFLAKFVEATLANAGLFVSVAAPGLFAYSLARGDITMPFILHLAIVLVAFAALPTALGVLLSFLLMRVLPPGRTRDLLAALGIMAFAAVYFALSMSVGRTGDAISIRQDTRHLAATLSQPVFLHGPWAWAGDVFNGTRTATEAWQAAGFLALLAAASIAAAAALAQRIHWRGWAAAQEAHTAAKPLGAGDDRWENRLAFLPGPMRAVLLKDLRSLRRDMRQLSLLFIPIAVVAVYLVNVTQVQLKHVPPVMLVFGLLPILAMIALRLAMSGFVTENRAIWVMMAAPNDPAAVLAGKFLYAFALSLPLAWVTTGLYGLLKGLSGPESIAGLVLALCAIAGFCGIGVGASAVFSDFTSENPRFTISAGGRLATFGFQMAYMVLLLAAAGLGIAAARAGLAPAPAAYAAAAGVIGAVSLAFVVVPLMVGASRLRRLEW